MMRMMNDADGVVLVVCAFLLSSVAEANVGPHFCLNNFWTI